MTILLHTPVCDVETMRPSWFSSQVRPDRTTFLLMISSSLSPEHFAVAVPIALVAAAGGFLAGLYFSKRSCKKGQVNTSISKDSPKVVHSFDMEDIGTKAVYCRCWRSKKVSRLLRCFTIAGRLSCWRLTALKIPILPHNYTSCCIL